MSFDQLMGFWLHTVARFQERAASPNESREIETRRTSTRPEIARVREIRFHWVLGAHVGDGNSRDSGSWHLATQKNRTILGAAVIYLNRRYGEGTHWVEERDA